VSLRTRVVALVVIVVVLATASVAYIRWSRPPAADPVVTSPGSVSLVPGPRLLAVTDRHLSAVTLDAPDGPRSVSDVECVRAYAAAGTGVCLRADTPWSYQVVVLDADLRERQSFAIPGLPNRARVSASGRMVAWTTFVGGDSYATGGFSTRTGILDTRDGTLLASVEDFAITRDGRPYRNVDVNYWGVTFAADDNRFYATLFTDGRRYLVRGDWAARTVETLAVNVECPSLSPDGTRIAFKRAIDGDPAKGWRLSTMDLASMAVTPTAERTSVDDQAAWLDADTLAYTLRGNDGSPDIWAVPADGSGQPRILMPGAESPSPLTPPA
jgi:hypothetical protein